MFSKHFCNFYRVCGLFLGIVLIPASSAEPLPGRLQGTWRITRVLPTSNVACWSDAQARPLIGSLLTYSTDSLRWKGGSVPLLDINTRSLSADAFMRESGDSGSAARFAQLGIHAPAVTEVDLQHEDMDITGATTEVPGDSVLLAGPNRIVVSACGVYFEATRNNAVTRASLHR